MNRLKQLRIEFGYTVRDLESLSKYDFTSVSYYENENRKMNPSVLMTFAILFDVTIDYLLNFTDLGIYIYDNNNNRILLHESEFLAYKSKNQIEYKEGKRYLK